MKVAYTDDPHISESQFLLHEKTQILSLETFKQKFLEGKIKDGGIIEFLTEEDYENLLVKKNKKQLEILI